MSSPNRCRSVTWLKDGHVYSLLDCFGIVSEVCHDLSLPAWPGFAEIARDDGDLDREARQMVLTLERHEPYEGIGAACYSGSIVTHVGIMVSIDDLLHAVGCNPGTDVTFLPLPRFKR